jgi:endonuclease/exonuclease/phosphatase family metal-dependent hydrolase
MKTIKVLQWNVWYEEKAENIVALINKIDADIVCCQELLTLETPESTVDIPKLIAGAKNYNFYFQPAIVKENPENGKKLQLGNGIFSRFPISNEKCIYVQKKDPNSEAYDSEDRVYIEVEANIDGKKLKVGTTHLSYSAAFAMTEKRLKEADELYSAIQSNHDRFILTGDMNAKPDSPIIKKLEEMFIHADPNTDRPTWTTKPFSYQGFEADKLDWRLDYIFATEDINVISNKIVETNFSDHLPILAEIQI